MNILNRRNRIIISLAATVLMPIIFYYFYRINNTFLSALSGDIILVLIAVYALVWLAFLLIFVGNVAIAIDERISKSL